MNEEKFTVHYACDDNDDHTAFMSECKDSGIIEFTTEKEMIQFITECTYVYNLNEVFSTNAETEDMPNPILALYDVECI